MRKKLESTVNGNADRAPHPRTYTDWTPALIRSVLRQSDTGNLQRAGELCEWLLTSPTVAGTLSARIDQVMQLELGFTAAENDPQATTVDASGEEQTAIVAALAKDFSDLCPDDVLEEVLQWTLLLGVCIARRTLTESEDGRAVVAPEVWHPSCLTYYPRDRRWTARDLDGVEHVVVLNGVVDPGWWFASLGGNRPWARGLWRSITLPALGEQYARQDWARTSEKAAMWVASVVVDKDGNPFIGTTDAQRRALVAALDDRGSDASIALPAGWQLALMQQADTYNVYMQQISMLGDAIALRVRGGNLTSNTSGGSLAAAKAQADTGDAPKRKSDAKRLSAIVSDQIELWAEYNYGDETLAPTATWREPVSTQLANIGTLAQAVSTFDQLGYTLDIEKLKQSGAGFITGRDDAIAEANRQKPAAGGFGGGFGARATALHAQCDHEHHSHSVPRAAAVSGITPGQAAVDDYVDQAIAGAPDDTDAILEVIRSATDASDLRMKMLKRYAHLDLTPLASALEKASILAHLVGRVQVLDEI